MVFYLFNPLSSHLLEIKSKKNGKTEQMAPQTKSILILGGKYSRKYAQRACIKIYSKGPFVCMKLSTMWEAGSNKGLSNRPGVMDKRWRC